MVGMEYPILIRYGVSERNYGARCSSMERCIPYINKVSGWRSREIVNWWICYSFFLPLWVVL